MPPKYMLMSRKMQNINTFIKIGGRMKIYTYQGKKNVSGEKIRQMRNMKRMSQSALAAKMHDCLASGRREKNLVA